MRFQGVPMLDKASIPRDQLKSIIERIERLEEEKAAIAGDIRKFTPRQKATVYDVKALRKIGFDPQKRPEQAARRRSCSRNLYGCPWHAEPSCRLSLIKLISAKLTEQTHH